MTLCYNMFIIHICFLCLFSLVSSSPSELADIFSVSVSDVETLLDQLGSVNQADTWLKAVTAPNRSLLVVDMQNDFITGSLAVTGAKDILSPLSEVITDPLWDQVVFTQDWHPTDHVSFFSNVQSRPLLSDWLANHTEGAEMFKEAVFKRKPPYKQVLWPDHCIQNSEGAKIHTSLQQPPNSFVIKKGINPEVDSYSAFFDNTGTDHSGDTGLAGLLEGSTEVVVVGLALDFCVGFSALDSLGIGLPTAVLSDLSKPVAIASGEAMEDKVSEAGGRVTSWENYHKKMVNEEWSEATKVANFLIANKDTSGTTLIPSPYFILPVYIFVNIIFLL